MAKTPISTIVQNVANKAKETEKQNKEYRSLKSKYKIFQTYNISEKYIETILENTSIINDDMGIAVGGIVIKSEEHFLSVAGDNETVSIEVMANETADDNETVREVSELLHRMENS